MPILCVRNPPRKQAKMTVIVHMGSDLVSKTVSIIYLQVDIGRFSKSVLLLLLLKISTVDIFDPDAGALAIEHLHSSC